MSELLYTTFMAIPRACIHPRCVKRPRHLIHQQQPGDSTKDKLQTRFTFVCRKHFNEIQQGKH